MFSLKSILEEHANVVSSIPGGSDQLQRAKAAGSARKLADKKRLQVQLASLRTTNTWCIVALTAMILAVLVTTVWLVRSNLANPTVVTSLFVGFATVTGGLTAVILAIFKVLERSHVIMMLSESLDASSLQTVLDVLAKH
jgi:hypothetical protein